MLWEFTDADLGYTYGRPIITKTHAFGGKWVVIVPSGYNNPPAWARSYSCDANDGKLHEDDVDRIRHADQSRRASRRSPATRRTSTTRSSSRSTAATCTATSGASISPIRIRPIGQSAKQLANLTDPGGNPQPVTTPPQIEIDIANGIDRWVFVGTGTAAGRHGPDDPAIANQIQTMYAIRDGTKRRRNQSLPRWAAATPDAAFRWRTRRNGLAAKPDNGWYDDLPLGAAHRDAGAGGAVGRRLCRYVAAGPIPA